MIYVYTGLTLWLVMISLTIYYAFILPNAIERQELYVEQLFEALCAHPFPDYTLRLIKEEWRLERLRRRVWRVEWLT